MKNPLKDWMRLSLQGFFGPIGVVVFASLLTGCIGFKLGKEPAPLQKNVSAQNGKKVTIFCCCKELPGHYLTKTDGKLDASSRLDKKVNKAFYDAFSGSGSYRLVTDPKDADFVLNCRFGFHTGKCFDFISALSLHMLGIIPVWGKVDVDIEVEVKRNDEILKLFKARRSWEMVAWTPLLVATPLLSPFRAEGKVIQSLVNALLADLDKDGLLEGTRPELASSSAN